MANPINYDPLTPTKQLPFSDWQIQFIQNFTQLYDAFLENHIALDDPAIANRGNHTYVEMPQQIQDPQTGANEFSIFAKDVDGQTDQVFFTYPGNSPVVQFTNYQIYSVLATPNQTTFFTFLPGKLLVYFGTFGPFGTGSSGNNTLILNPPIAKNVISVNLCLNSATPNYTPAIFINPPEEGFVKKIDVIAPIPSTNNKVFYIVVANL